MSSSAEREIRDAVVARLRHLMPTARIAVCRQLRQRSFAEADAPMSDEVA